MFAHKALLTYIRGFNWPHCYYYCGHCTPQKISWHFGDDDAAYKASLASEESILTMVKAKPDLAWEKNLFGKTPISLIPMLLEVLMGITDNPYKKFADDSRARENWRSLMKIQAAIKAYYTKN